MDIPFLPIVFPFISSRYILLLQVVEISLRHVVGLQWRLSQGAHPTLAMLVRQAAQLSVLLLVLGQSARVPPGVLQALMAPAAFHQRRRACHVPSVSQACQRGGAEFHPEGVPELAHSSSIPGTGDASCNLAPSQFMLGPRPSGASGRPAGHIDATAAPTPTVSVPCQARSSHPRSSKPHDATPLTSARSTLSLPHIQGRRTSSPSSIMLSTIRSE